MHRHLRCLARAGAAVWLLAWLGLPARAGAGRGLPARSLRPEPSGPAAAQIVLYDQTGNGTDQSWADSTDFPANYDNIDSQGADDFVVPTDKFWAMSTVSVLGKYFGGTAAVAHAVLVEFYANGPANLPSALVQSRTIVGSQAIDDFVLSLSPPVVLGPGHYWVSVQAQVTPVQDEGWGWHESTELSLYQSVWRQPSGFLVPACTTFQPRIDVCHWPSGSTNPDLAFKLEGTTLDVVAKVLLPIVLR